jgi:S-adenosylmethionine hydrolase
VPEEPPPPAGAARCLTLTTDYGLEAGFVGILHAVAYGIAPGVEVIDLDHSVPPQDVRLGALRLERFMTYLPPGVHVAVVDPGVGGDRRGVAIAAGRQILVGPDNGLLVWAAEAAASAVPAAAVPDDGVAGAGNEEAPGTTPARIAAVVLDREDFWLPRRARTFDGRDIFVPVAAHLAAGTQLDQVGTAVELSSLVHLQRPRVRPSQDGGTELEVLQVDGFGNVQLSGGRAVAEALGLAAGDAVSWRTGEGGVVATYVSTFAEVARGALALLLDSDGHLALSVNQGRADALLPAAPGTPGVLRAGG